MENYHGKLKDLFAETKDNFEQLGGILSALDRKISDIYHDIERKEFNVAEGHGYALELRETLRNRRVVKNEIHKLLPVYELLREIMDKVDERYDRAVRKSYELGESLYVTASIDEVLAAFSGENKFTT